MLHNQHQFHYHQEVFSEKDKVITIFPELNLHFWQKYK